jgi:hypothetical protein
MITTITQNGFWRRCMAIICMLLAILQTELLSAAAVYAAELSFATSYLHDVPGFIMPGARTIIQGRIIDPRGVKEVRCYFKIDGEADYLFVPMVAEAEDRFSATLPALGKNAQALKYRLLAVNNANQLSKTAEFRIPVTADASTPPPWQASAGSGFVRVSTESEVRAAGGSRRGGGFSDTLAIDVVEPSERLLVRSGTSIAVTKTTGPPEIPAAVNGATIKAQAAPVLKATADTPARETIMGLSPTTFWWIVGGVVAVAIGGAIAASSGGGGGGGAPSNGTVKIRW